MNTPNTIHRFLMVIAIIFTVYSLQPDTAYGSDPYSSHPANLSPETPAVPVVQDSDPVPVKTSQTPNTSSTDFLISSPLSTSIPEATPDLPVSVSGIADHPSSLNTNAAPKDSLALMVSETCQSMNGGDSSPIACHRVYSNGHYATVITQSASMGDEYKQQSVTEEFNSEGLLISKKTVRHRIDYNYANDDKRKERELVDVVYEPVGEKITRELTIHQYHLDSGKTKSMTWAQYEQIGQSSDAALVYHIALYYDPVGNPDRGLAEKWDHGKKIANYLDWNSSRQGSLGYNRSTWHDWESWLRNITPQTHLG